MTIRKKDTGADTVLNFKRESKIAFLTYSYTNSSGGKRQVLIDIDNSIIRNTPGTGYGPTTNKYITNNGNANYFTALVPLRWIGSYGASGASQYTSFDVTANTGGNLIKNSYIVLLDSKIILL